MSDFKPVCPGCGELLPTVDYKTGYGARSERCPECGCRTGLTPHARAYKPRATAVVAVAPSPRELVTDGRYVVRETTGFRINFPIQKASSQAVAGVECVVLDTGYNYRRVASFESEAFVGYGNRSYMIELARKAAAERCDELNRAAA